MARKGTGFPFGTSDLLTPFTLKSPPKPDPRFTVTEKTVLRKDLKKFEGISPSATAPPLGLTRERPVTGLKASTRPDQAEDTATDLPSLEKDASGGGFISFLTSKKKTLPAKPIANFGLPTNRLPTIDELGGAIGGFAKYVSQLTKFNRARGLSPGIPITKTRDRAGVGLVKAKLTTLTKLHETATLSGDTEKASKIEEMINAILQGDDASFDEGINADLAEIAGL